MPDTDVLAAAFASFADGAGADITSPGSAAVRQTVRHRRSRRAVVTALALVAVLAGGIATWGRAGPGHHGSDSADWIQHPEPAATLEAYREEAVNAMPRTGSALTSDSAAITGLHYTNPARDFPDVANGPVTIYFACVGTGSLSINVHVRGSSWSGDYGCNDDGIGVVDGFAFGTEGGYLYVEISAVSTCVRRCSFA
jgi:hypothetical protein